MSSTAPNVMIARLQQPSEPAQMLYLLTEEKEGKLQMLLSPRKTFIDSLFKEARAFKVLEGAVLGWGQTKEPASHCAHAFQNYPVANYPLVSPEFLKRDPEMPEMKEIGTISGIETV